ncbi:hypothetical protein Bca52824_068981 [Brassica carinata]|uniref:Uncharacterized protein n=1 Tax=Brassica carinata TaxID=52824 RepID=A0A8X7U103_BRACI|nr:hypothetical protein Bca52824_068981 [Brassica carinata]
MVKSSTRLMELSVHCSELRFFCKYTFAVLPKTFKDFSGWIILRVSRGAPGRTFLTTHGGCWFDGERCCGHREEVTCKTKGEEVFESNFTTVATLKRLSGILGGILHSAYFPFRKKKSLWVLLADSNNICFFPKEKASRQIIMQLEKFRLCEKIKSGSRLVLQPLSELFIDLKSYTFKDFSTDVYHY